MLDEISVERSHLGMTIFRRKEAKEALRYFSTAVAGLALDWTIWLVLDHLTLRPALSQACSRTAGGLLVFWMLKNFAFQRPAITGHALRIRYWSAWAFSWCMSLTLVAGISQFEPAIIAKFISDGLTFVTNYVVMKYWVFGSYPSPGLATENADV